MFKYSLDNKRYHTLNYFYKNKFHDKVFKISLNGNFSCPNFKNGNGCIFVVMVQETLLVIKMMI